MMQKDLEKLIMIKLVHAVPFCVCVCVCLKIYGRDDLGL
jgi:hypothetical protein